MIINAKNDEIKIKIKRTKQVCSIGQIGHSQQVTLGELQQCQCQHKKHENRCFQDVAIFSCKPIFLNYTKNFININLYSCFKVTQFQCRIFTSIPSRDAENTAPHHPTLLYIQSHVGLDHFVSHLLHVRVRALQRGVQVKNDGRRAAARRRQHRRRCFLSRHRAQLSHDLRESNR